ncbi:hypothetical protein [Vibrio coralliilyticus]|uniref:hypothetical protein n=1 Tax=Vibrio coralliilyticus TaxID=190893 RepID=UPI0031F2E950
MIHPFHRSPCSQAIARHLLDVDVIRLKAWFIATLTKRLVQLAIVMLHKMGFQPAVHGLLTVK